MNARFVVAKYIPDLRRMEPRNIGVVVWSDGRTAARFLGEDDALPPHLGVRDKSNYREWITSWKNQLAKPVLETDRGETVKRSDPAFLDVLREWSRKNYVLVDGGEVADKSSHEDLGVIAEYLFSELVSLGETKAEREHEYQVLRAASTHVLREAGLPSLPNWRHTDPMWYKALGVLKYFDCDYVLGPLEHPYSIYQRVALKHQKTFESTLFHLYWVQQSRDFGRERCAAMIVGPASPTKEQSENRAMLESVATVVDVSRADEARCKLLEIASHNGKL
jgi:hypothetical protein